MLSPTCSINEKGRLALGSCDTVELAKEYGTPLYAMDEDLIRARCRAYREGLASAGDGLACFAGKALCVTELYRIIAEEGLGADVVSPGELYTALRADFPAEKLEFHGNNKTDADVAYGVKAGVGRFVADNREELDAIEAAAAAAGRKQKILLRITPGIDPHTHKKIITGSVDSKFGSAIATGQAAEIVKYALSLPHIDLTGLHCHVGSQIFDLQPFTDAADIMTAFLADLKKTLGFEAQELNLGGGLGVPYTEDDPVVDYRASVAAIASRVTEDCRDLGIARPRVMLEPGRAIVADSGVTLYTVGSVKNIPGFRTYVSIDGGMPDNPRYALYESRYTVTSAERAGEAKTLRVTLAGRCCESGDLIGEDLPLQPCARGDILAVLVTGAYNYSMASNYNRIPRPAMVFIRGGQPRLVLRRETYEDLVACEVPR